jgi:hypothetical protein
VSEQTPAQNPDAPQGGQSAERAKTPEKFKAEKLEPKEGKEIKAEVKEKPEGKLEIKEKPEKFEKNEFKEQKPEGKVEVKEKPEKFEIKEKPEKFEKNEFKEHKLEGKIEIKEHFKELKFEKLELEGPLPSVPVPDPGPVQVDRQTLLGYAAALEKAGQDLRHFIEQSERPDLTHGALQNESDDEPRADS